MFLLPISKHFIITRKYIKCKNAGTGIISDIIYTVCFMLVFLFVRRYTIIYDNQLVLSFMFCLLRCVSAKLFFPLKGKIYCFSSGLEKTCSFVGSAFCHCLQWLANLLALYMAFHLLFSSRLKEIINGNSILFNLLYSKCVIEFSLIHNPYLGVFPSNSCFDNKAFELYF